MIQKIEAYIKQLDAAMDNLAMASDNMSEDLQTATSHYLKLLRKEYEDTRTFYLQGRKLQ